MVKKNANVNFLFEMRSHSLKNTSMYYLDGQIIGN